jgi:hypothetical protein
VLQALLPLHAHEPKGNGLHTHQLQLNKSSSLLDSMKVSLQHLLKPWLHAGCVFDTSSRCKRPHAAGLVATFAVAGLSTVQPAMVPAMFARMGSQLRCVPDILAACPAALAPASWLQMYDKQLEQALHTIVDVSPVRDSLSSEAGMPVCAGDERYPSPPFRWKPEHVADVKLCSAPLSDIRLAQSVHRCGWSSLALLAISQ